MAFSLGDIQLRHGLMLAPMAGVTDYAFRRTQKKTPPKNETGLPFWRWPCCFCIFHNDIEQSDDRTSRKRSTTHTLTE